MTTIPNALYSEEQLVYVYGIEEYEAKVVSNKYINNTWFYIVQFTENQQCALYSEDSLSKDV